MQSAVRILVAIVACIFIAVGLVTIALGQALSGAWTLILGLIGIVVVLYERRRYRSEPTAGVEARIHPTEEVFVDPSTGERMRVHIDPESGERHYLPDSPEPDRPSRG
ncbi:MAG: hypothetical protein M3R49_02520 [Chloroflexota bacterium]|nr:hypothetical protein [Chloroflexota bacterium]